MPNKKGIITVIAERYGVTDQHVRDVIRSNPDLGVIMGRGKTTVLDNNQISAVCALLDAETRGPQLPRELASTSSDTKSNANEDIINYKYEKKLLEYETRIRELESQLSQALTDKAVAEARADERQGRIDDLRGQLQGTAPLPLLTAAQERAEAAEKEAASFRRGIFGFYRKSKK